MSILRRTVLKSRCHTKEYVILIITYNKTIFSLADFLHFAFIRCFWSRVLWRHPKTMARNSILFVALVALKRGIWKTQKQPAFPATMSTDLALNSYLNRKYFVPEEWNTKTCWQRGFWLIKSKLDPAGDEILFTPFVLSWLFDYTQSIAQIYLGETFSLLIHCLGHFPSRNDRFSFLWFLKVKIWCLHTGYLNI